MAGTAEQVMINSGSRTAADPISRLAFSWRDASDEREISGNKAATSTSLCSVSKRPLHWSTTRTRALDKLWLHCMFISFQLLSSFLCSKATICKKLSLISRSSNTDGSGLQGEAERSIKKKKTTPHKYLPLWMQNRLNIKNLRIVRPQFPGQIYA